MSKIYLPHAAQIDEMNEYLSKIANALSSDIDLSTWAGIQKAVRIGVAPDLIPVGTQLVVNHSVYGDMLYDVVAHNYYKSAYDENAHTMTLMCHDTINAMQFDSPEAFYYAENDLPAGTYNVVLKEAYMSWSAGTYQFTLSKVLPKGGQLCISGYADTAITERSVKVYASRTTVEASEIVAITSGNGGTNLGTFGVELNHVHRVSYGSNNYKESAIRQFLNSGSAAGSVWIPQTKFDRPPAWQTSFSGFMNGMDNEFLSCVGEVIVPCSSNDTYESPGSDTVRNGKYALRDKFYLASQREVFGASTNSVDDSSTQFSYYNDATNIDRIKYKNGVASYWWTRSAYSRTANHIQVVVSDGTQNVYYAVNDNGCVPVCTIV